MDFSRRGYLYSLDVGDRGAVLGQGSTVQRSGSFRVSAIVCRSDIFPRMLTSEWALGTAIPCQNLILRGIPTQVLNCIQVFETIYEEKDLNDMNQVHGNPLQPRDRVERRNALTSGVRYRWTCVFCCQTCWGVSLTYFMRARTSLVSITSVCLLGPCVPIVAADATRSQPYLQFCQRDVCALM